MKDRKEEILAEIMRHLAIVEDLRRELESVERRPRDSGLFKRGGLTREQFRAGIRAMEKRP